MEEMKDSQFSINIRSDLIEKEQKKKKKKNEKKKWKISKIKNYLKIF